MRVTLHRGNRRIGGNCIEVSVRGARLVLDLGLPLDAQMPRADKTGSWDKTAIDELIGQMEQLKTIFDKIDISTTKITPEIDKETNVTTLRSEVTTNLTPEVFTELSKKVAEIRTSFVK